MVPGVPELAFLPLPHSGASMVQKLMLICLAYPRILAAAGTLTPLLCEQLVIFMLRELSFSRSFAHQPCTVLSSFQITEEREK